VGETEQEPQGDALNDAVDRQNWDASVKALVPLPEVLSMMSEKTEWTQRLGDAFLSQQDDVMDTVQRLRRRPVMLEISRPRSSRWWLSKGKSSGSSR